MIFRSCILTRAVLTDGRQKWPGTSKNPEDCIGIRIARDWLQYSPIHAIYILLSTGFIVSKSSCKKLPLSYYKHRMEMLAEVRAVIANERSSYSYRLYAIMVMVWAAYTMQWPDLQMHLRAVDVLLNSTEAGQRFAARELEGPTLRPQWLVGMFLVTEYHISTHYELTIARVRFIVEDTGIGMDPAAQARLFQPFTEGEAPASHHFNGTGLALTLAKRLADQFLERDFVVRRKIQPV